MPKPHRVPTRDASAPAAALQRRGAEDEGTPSGARTFPRSPLACFLSLYERENGALAEQLFADLVLSTVPGADRSRRHPPARASGSRSAC